MMVGGETTSSKRTMKNISILTGKQQAEQAIKSHGRALSSNVEKSPLAVSKSNVSRAAMKAAMGSFGILSGPIDGVSMNHPNRGQTKNAKSR